jgi:hypothetical protein
MKIRSAVLILSLAAFAAPGPAHRFGALREEPQPAPALEPYIEIDLLRLEETYRLIGTFGETIWPGWKNDMEVEYQLQYPNLVFVTVGPRDGKVPEGYVEVPGRAVRGKKIYVNRKDALPIKLLPPLIGGGKGGMTIRIMLQQTGITAELAAKAIAEAEKNPNPGFQPPCPSEGQILLIVHEFFHGFQTKVMKREEGGRKGRDFEIRAEYATYTNIEGLALRDAFLEKDDAKALARFKDYSVARELKRFTMPPDAVAYQAGTTLSEGTASYSDTRMAMLVGEKGYVPNMSAKDDPFFYGYRYVGGYIHEKTIQSIEHAMGSTLNTLAPCYTYGLFQCLLLDRFYPDWKHGFFGSGQSLDDITESRLGLSPEEKKSIAADFESKYRSSELMAKHAAVIKDRDETMAIVNSRTGRRYIIDFRKTKDFIIPTPRGRSVRLGVEVFYADGIEEFRLGDIVLTTADTPMYQPKVEKNMYSLEWVDTAAKPGVKGYAFTYEKQEGDVYKNVEFKTAGFTLKAPEVQLVEDPQKDEVTVVIVRKVVM